MNRRMDEIVKGYPELVQKRDCLAYQLAHFRGFTADEIIESMYTPRQDGERVQTSNLSDKTAQIALDYQERRERINREWYEQMEKELQMVSDEVTFFEAAVHALPIKIRGGSWMNNNHTQMTEDFLDYARPLIQAELTPLYIAGLPHHQA